MRRPGGEKTWDRDRAAAAAGENRQSKNKGGQAHGDARKYVSQMAGAKMRTRRRRKLAVDTGSGNES